MKTNFRNVTVTLEQDVARWARIEAARQDTSVSQLLARILKERMREADDYDRAMSEALARKPFLKTDGRYLSREEVHERPRFRRSCRLRAVPSKSQRLSGDARPTRR